MDSAPRLPDGFVIADKVWLGLDLTDDEQQALDDAAGIDADFDNVDCGEARRQLGWG